MEDASASAGERSVGATPTGRRRFTLTGAQETLAIPLYARALDFRSRRSILHDAKADEIVRSLDYDFEALRAGRNGSILAARGRQLDEWVRAFLREHPDAVVLHVGCGLDTRRFRLAPAASVRWYDVDLPDVIALRRTLFAEEPEYRMLAASLTEPEWLGTIPSGRPTIAVADGVFGYLAEEEVVRFLRDVSERFPRGAAVFDVLSAWVERTANRHLQARSSARLRWAVDDLRRLDALLPRFRRTATARLIASRYLPARTRLVGTLAQLLPGAGTAMRAVRYEYGSGTAPARGEPGGAPARRNP